jgi:hypothetical protein
VQCVFSFINIIKSTFYCKGQSFSSSFRISTRIRGDMPIVARGISRGGAAAVLLGMWVRIPPGAWMFVSCECCQVEADHSSWGALPTVVCLECDREVSIMRRTWPTGVCCAVGKNKTTFFLNRIFIIKNFKRKSFDLYRMSVIAHALAYYGCLLLRFVSF